MKRAILYLGIIVLLGCADEQKDPEYEETVVKKAIEERDATKTKKLRPKATWKVNKQFDSLGNLVRYDSIYSWSYSNISGDSAQIDMDQMIRLFYDQVDNNFPLSLHQKVPGMYEWDSLFYKQFMLNDDFRSDWEESFFEMQSAIERMDSLRYEFYKDFTKNPK